MFARLIFLFIVLTVYVPVYSQDISIGQRIKELKKTQKLHVVFDSKLNLKAPANSVIWEQKYNPQNEMLPFHKTKCSETQNEASSL